MSAFIEALQNLMNPDGLGGAIKPSNDAGSSLNTVGSRSQTGFTGVTLHKRTQRFEAHIWSDKKQIYLGSYNTKSQAARVHDLMALKVGKAVADCDSSSRSTGGGGSEINFPVEDYKEILPLLSTISQHDLIVTLRNYGKSLNASGYPTSSSHVAITAGTSIATATAPSSSPAAAAASTPSPKIPINLPSQFQYNPVSLLARASSLPDERRARKRKQDRPNSSLDSCHSKRQGEEEGDEEGGFSFNRGRTLSPPFDLPRPNKIMSLSRAGSLPAPSLPLFQTNAHHNSQKSNNNSLGFEFGALPHPPPLQLAPLQAQQAGTNPHFLRTPRKREFHEA